MEEPSTLRERVHATPEEKPTLAPQPEETQDHGRKTYGRTLGGHVFVVPQTHDMVSTLLSPTTPKKTIDIAILAVLAFDIFLYFTLPNVIRTPVLLLMFAFWRAAYNYGIGYLLEGQSKYNQMVKWAQKYGIFDEKKQPLLYKFIREDIESKVAAEIKSGDYKFEDAPIEYNTWLVFRRVVDLILMNDFVTYVLFAMSAAHQPVGEAWYLTAGRWIGGAVLFLFNLWVKLDAHRVVKDYAWYWGDFFYLIDQNLTFDGVFEMAPHPMYSVGYAGYYGISLFAASYTVLFASLAAHAAQFVFLTYIENPHIEKTYNPPAPRRKSTSATVDTSILEDGSQTSKGNSFIEDLDQATTDRPLNGRPDLLNSTHFATMILLVYTALLTFATPNTTFMKALFVLQAFCWRMWYTFGIGAILTLQSNNKSFVRHFLKHGETLEDAWRQWKGVYYVSLTMTHASFIAAGWKLYNFPSGGEGITLFRHVLGLMLISLQVWTAWQVYESLGEFGWFYGDFFYEQQQSGLTYSGIYRYLNNPERLIGCAGIWGIVLITSSSPIFLLGLFSHVCALLFINLVERPHMQKLYGTKIRREAGVAKTIRKAIPAPVAQHVRIFQGSIDKIVADASKYVEELLQQSSERLPAAFKTAFQVTQSRLAPTRLAIELLPKPASVDGVDRSQYSVSVVNGTHREGNVAEVGQALSVAFGEPIRLKWSAPKDHSKKDWIGLYHIEDNSSREVTRIASMGRWVAVCPDQYETHVPEIGVISTDVPTENPDIVTGEVEFAKEKLVWENGSYELRYHHDGKHIVMAISEPIQIKINKVVLDDDEIKFDGAQKSVENALLPVVKRVFGNEDDLAPEDCEDEFRSLEEGKYAKRIIYAIREMFGVDFDPRVVRADGNVRKLAWRITNARKVLAPFSGTSSTMTPNLVSPPASPKR